MKLKTNSSLLFRLKKIQKLLFFADFLNTLDIFFFLYFLSGKFLSLGSFSLDRFYVIKKIRLAEEQLALVGQVFLFLLYRDCLRFIANFLAFPDPLSLSHKARHPLLPLKMRVKVYRVLPAINITSLIVIILVPHRNTAYISLVTELPFDLPIADPGPTLAPVW